MSNKIFTATEIEILSMNPHVKKVSSKGITYTDEFKRIFISENKNVTDYLRLELATDTIHTLKKSAVQLHKDVFIHSD